MPKCPLFVDADSDDSDDEDEEGQPQKVSKSPGPVRMESNVSDHDKPMVKRIQKLSKIATPGKEAVVKQPPRAD